TIRAAHRTYVFGEDLGQLELRPGDIVAVAAPGAVDQSGDFLEPQLLRVDVVEFRGTQAMHQHRGRTGRAAELIEPQRPELPRGIERAQLLADAILDLALKGNPLGESLPTVRPRLRLGAV